ncbi:MAG: hypothetical protein ACRET2_07510, partial [Steroidobacteraceae bacterium]
MLENSVASLDAVGDLRRLLLRGFAQLTDDTRIVVDEFHLVTDELIHDDLVALLRGSSRVHLIVASRALGPLHSERVALEFAPVVIPGDELEFTPAETREVLVRSGSHVLDEKQLGMLRRTVGGAPLLTKAVAAALVREGRGFESSVLEHAAKAAGSQILGETLRASAFSAEEIDFGLRASVPDVLTIDLARELTGSEDAEAMLDSAEAYGLGMWSPSADGPTFSYSPIARSAIREELARRFPAEVPKLNRLVAIWSFNHDQSLAALSHAVAAHDLDLAAKFVVRDWGHLLRYHREALCDIIGALPLRVLRRRPILTMVAALAYNASPGFRMRAVEFFALAIVSSRLHGRTAPPAERVVLVTLESAANRVMGRGDRSVAAAQKADTLLHSLTAGQRDELGKNLPTILAHLGLSHFYAGSRERAADLFLAAYSQPRSLSSTGWFHGLSLAAGAFAVQGDMLKARALIERAAGEVWPEGWRAGYIGAFLQLAEAFCELETGDYAAAILHVALMRPHLDTIEHWPLFMQVQAMVALGTGRAVEGTTILDVASAHGAHPPIGHLSRGRLDAARALLLMASGRVHDAETMLRRHAGTVPEVDISWARLHLLVGVPARALAALQAIEQESVSVRVWAETLALRAAASIQLDRTDAALDDLDRVIATLVATGLRSPYTLLPKAARLALSDAAQKARRATMSPVLLAELAAVPSVWPEGV